MTLRPSTRMAWTGPVAIMLALLTASTLHAAPAAWYWWESQLDARRVCAQTSPGAAWTRVSGPFRDAGCRQPR